MKQANLIEVLRTYDAAPRENGAPALLCSGRDMLARILLPIISVACLSCAPAWAQSASERVFSLFEKTCATQPASEAQIAGMAKQNGLSPGIFFTDEIVPAGRVLANAWYIAMPEHRGSIRLGVIYEGNPEDHTIYCDVSSSVISGEDMLTKMQALLKLGESSSRKSNDQGRITLEWVVQPEPAWRKFTLEFKPSNRWAGTALGFARRNVAQ
jgi:hypothetical protein